jgi:hypothetical protein
MSNKNRNKLSSELLLNLLQLKNQMKLYHWQTKKHSRHVGSHIFLQKYDDVLDSLIEAYQGKYNTIKLNKDMKILNIPDNKIIEFLKKAREYLNNIAPKLFNKENNGDLFNLKDEILEIIDKTIYLFKQK